MPYTNQAGAAWSLRNDWLSDTLGTDAIGLERPLLANPFALVHSPHHRMISKKDSLVVARSLSFSICSGFAVIRRRPLVSQSCSHLSHTYTCMNTRLTSRVRATWTAPAYPKNKRGIYATYASFILSSMITASSNKRSASWEEHRLSSIQYDSRPCG